MIAVDTSVWVEVLRDGSSPTADTLKTLLDGDLVAILAPVRIELLAGAGRAGQANLRRLLSALPLWVPVASTWELVDSWLGPASRAGERFGVADLLIGATSTERTARLWSFDQDFSRMAALGFVELFESGY